MNTTLKNGECPDGLGDLVFFSFKFSLRSNLISFRGFMLGVFAE